MASWAFDPTSSRTDRVFSMACDLCPCVEHGVMETKQQGLMPDSVPRRCGIMVQARPG
jgi:hypothetical protein